MTQRIISATLAACLLAFGAGNSQNVKVGVTFFDFHSNGSCPDFNPGLSAGDAPINSGTTLKSWDPYNETYVTTTAQSTADGWVIAMLDGKTPTDTIRLYTSDYAVPTLHLVEDTLDKDGLPVANHSYTATTASGDCLFSRAIDRWFRPWKSKGGLDTIPNYVYDTNGVNDGRPSHSLGDGLVNAANQLLNVNYDTAYKNVSFNDSLTFNQIITKSNDTVYELRSDAFYPLDNRGFGAEIGTRNWSYYLPRNADEQSWVLGDLQAGAYRQTMNDLTSRVVNLRNAGGSFTQPSDPSPHNFSFAMKMERSFTYRSAANRPSGKPMYFAFRGDDDVWVFINGRLALDIGGLHDPVERVLFLDSLFLTNKFGLQEGKSATLSLFFCERQADGSDILITTNLVDGKPVRINLNTTPSGTVKAGTPVTITAILPSDTGVVKVDTVLQKIIMGTAVDINGGSYTNATSTDLGVADSTHKWIFTPQKAYTKVVIPFTFVRSDGVPLTAFDTLTILPGDPASVSIEGSPDTPTVASGFLWKANPLSSIAIQANQTSVTGFYAILRDLWGNWIGPDANVQSWTSEDNTIATGTFGTDRVNGEGLANKVKDGTTYIDDTSSAKYNGVNLTSRVQLNIASITYTALRIMTKDALGNLNQISELTLQIGYDSTVYVEGQRSDNGIWEPVAATWSTIGTSLGLTPPSGVVDNWNIVPVNAGSDSLVAVNGAAGIKIPLTVINGAPVKMVLFTDQAATMPVTGTLTATAGANLNIYARLYDAANNMLGIYVTDVSKADLISWSLAGTDLTNAGVSPAVGASTDFVSTRAYTTDTVKALFNDGLGHILTAVAEVYVKPDTAAQVDIEGSNDIAHINLNTATPLDPITISSTSNQTSVFLIVRDIYGNYVGFANSNLTTGTVDTTIAKSNVGDISYGEIVVTRVANTGTTELGGTYVTSTGLVLTDSSTITIAAYNYVKLRFATSTDVSSAANELDSLLINTNQNTTLYLKGKRSDNGQWEIVATVTWGKSVNLQLETQPPVGQSFNVAPKAPADTGFISAFTSIANPDSIAGQTVRLPVRFTVGPATRIELVFPSVAQKVGDTVVASVIVYNQDGRVPGNYTGNFDLWFDSTSLNLVGGVFGTDANGNPVYPFFKSMLAGGYTREQFGVAFDGITFTDGVTPLKVVVYKVPKDNTYEFTGVLVNAASPNDTAKANMTVVPGDLSRLQIVDVSRVPFNDTTTIAYDSSLTFISIGTDAYGNALGTENSNWALDATLHGYTSNTQNTYSIRFVPDSVTYNGGQAGWVKSSALTSIGLVSDSVYLIVSTRAARIVSAFTGDDDGNGLLDRVPIVFDQKVSTALLGYDPADVYVINTNGSTIDTLRMTDSLSFLNDSTVVLHLNEKDTRVYNPNGPSGFQTAWTPNVTLVTTRPGVAAISDMPTIDRAGPVIEMVTKTLDPSSSSSDHKKDLVKVFLSEGCGDADGKRLASFPNQLFKVYRDSGNVIVVDNKVLDSINSAVTYPGPGNDAFVQFYMTNNRDLTRNHWVKLLNSGGKNFYDMSAGNPPIDGNDSVQVVIVNVQQNISVGPNPFHPADVGTPDLTTYTTSTDIQNKINTDGGTMIQVSIGGILNDNINIDAKLVVFDAIGNLTATRTNADEGAVKVNRDSNNNIVLYYYWDGRTNADKPSNPGSYRLFFSINADGHTNKFYSVLICTKKAKK